MTTQDEILSELEGVILETSDQTVTVKLNGDTIVDFPRIIFDGKDFVKHGQPVSYQIKMNSRGIKYQDFVSIEKTGENPLEKEIEDALNNI